MGYKMKSKSSTAKRFKVTGSGKIKFKHAKMRHILGKKRHKSKRHLRKAGIMSDADAKVIHKLLPYK